MHILLDTNVLLWAVAATARLDDDTRDLLSERATDVLFSAASIWEIAIKFGLRRADFDADPERIADGALRAGFTELPIGSTAAARVANLPTLHRDPFDRLLIAQATGRPARFLTADRALAGYSELVTVIEPRPR